MPRGNADSTSTTLTVNPKPSAPRRGPGITSIPIQANIRRDCQGSFNSPRKNNIVDGNRFAILARLNDTSDSSHRALDSGSPVKLNRHRKRGKRGGKNSRNGKSSAHFEALNNLFTNMPLLLPPCVPSTDLLNDAKSQARNDITSSPATPKFHTPTRSLSTVTSPATPSSVAQPRPSITRCPIRHPQLKLRPDAISPVVRSSTPIFQSYLPMPSPKSTFKPRTFVTAPCPRPESTTSKISKALSKLHHESRFFPAEHTPSKSPPIPRDVMTEPSFFGMGHARNCWCCHNEYFKDESGSPPKSLEGIPTPPAAGVDYQARCATVDTSPAASVETIPSTPFEIISSDGEDQGGWSILLANEETTSMAECSIPAPLVSSALPSPPSTPIRERHARFRDATRDFEPKFPWEWSDPEWQWSELPLHGD